MGNLSRVLLERRVAVRIAIHVEREAHFVVRRFFSRARRRRWRCAGQLLSCLPGRAKFLPQQRSRRQLTGRILPLQRAQLTFQLPQRKRHVHFGRDKKRLNEKHQRNEEQHAAGKQNQTQPRPAFTARIGENKWRNLFRRKLRHATPTIAQVRELENSILSLVFVIPTEVEESLILKSK